MKIQSLRFATFFLFGCLLVMPALAEEPAKTPDTLETLQKRINDVVNQPRYNAALWGVKIESLDTGKVIYEHNAEKLCSPASNSKLYTMALALDRLGADFRIKTSLYAAGKPDENGVLKGDLVVYGRGDPTICGEYYGQDTLKALEPFVAALTNAGVKQITGNLVGDASYFRCEPYGAGWSWGDMENYYGAEISALSINSNVWQLVVKPGDSSGAPAKLTLDPPTSYIKIVNQTKTTAAKSAKRNLTYYHPLTENTIYVSGSIPMDDKGSSEDITMHDPAALFVSVLKDVLAKHGITVAGNTCSVNWHERDANPIDFKTWVELGAIESHPMREIIRSVQKHSQNQYTDMMLDLVGTRAGVGSSQTSEEAGVHELNNFLKQVGIKHDDTIFEDGSGLGRDNMTTPNATILLLAYMHRHKDAKVYYDALPVAGVDGTLRKRMKGTLAANNLHAKTGTLRWSHALSGYLTTAAGEHMAISIMLNRFHNAEKDRSSTADMDAIAVMLADFTVHTEK